MFLLAQTSMSTGVWKNNTVQVQPMNLHIPGLRCAPDLHRVGDGGGEGGFSLTTHSFSS